jgi:hypothetical protein
VTLCLAALGHTPLLCAVSLLALRYALSYLLMSGGERFLSSLTLFTGYLRLPCYLVPPRSLLLSLPFPLGLGYFVVKEHQRLTL